MRWGRYCRQSGAEGESRLMLPGPGSGLRAALITRHWPWCLRRCEATSDLVPSGPEDHVGRTSCRFPEECTYPVRAGERSAAGGSLLWRCFYLPFEAIGPREAFGVGRQRHGSGDEVARGRPLHPAADPRRRRLFDGDTIIDAGRRFGLDARNAKEREATGWDDVRSAFVAGDS